MAEKAANRKLNWSWKEILLPLKIREIKRRKKWKVSANKINASKKDDILHKEFYALTERTVLLHS